MFFTECEKHLTKVLIYGVAIGVVLVIILN